MKYAKEIVLVVAESIHFTQDKNSEEKFLNFKTIKDKYYSIKLSDYSDKLSDYFKHLSDLSIFKHRTLKELGTFKPIDGVLDPKSIEGISIEAITWNFTDGGDPRKVFDIILNFTTGDIQLQHNGKWEGEPGKPAVMSL